MNYKYRFLLLLLLLILLLGSLSVSVSASQPKLVALTFDDGPGPYTERLLDELSERNVRATFFCLGNRAELYPDLICRMIAEGHQVANHSYNHPNLNELSLDSALKQISNTDRILNGIIGGQESFFIRPPYGNTTQAIRSQLNAPVVIWSVDTIDWQLLNSTAVKDKILADTFDGSIVLMHDIHRTTIDGILAALDTLEARGYEFVTVKELMRRRGISAVNGQQYYRCDTVGNDLRRLRMPEMTINRAGESLVIDFVSPDGAPIYYTTDGSAIGYSAQRYDQTISIQLPCSIRAVAAWDLNGDRSEELSCTYTIPPAGIPTVSVERGSLIFTPADKEEFVYVKADDWEAYLPSSGAAVERGTWFSYYADGEGLASSPENRLLLTNEGNLVSDFDPDDWYYLSMDHCISKGYYKGNGQYRYNPSGVLSRGMLIELLYRFNGAAVTATDQPFTDVSEYDYYSNAVKWGFSEGIVNGTGGGIFAPDRPVSRQELAKMLAAYMGFSQSEISTTYLDHAHISDWALPYVQMVSESGLMLGSGGKFRPTDHVTRAEVSVILMRMDHMRVQ